MAIVAHSHPYVIGVDTHARNHALSVLDCPHGQVLDEALNRPGVSGDSVPWKGWGHVRSYVQEVPAGAA